MPWTKAALSRLLGERHEKQAAEYLQKQGLRLVESNYRCREGEIDLIMQHADTLVFVEVKYRSSANFGEPVAQFHQHKRAKFERAIAHYLHKKGINPAMQPQRIDLVAIYQQHIDWVQCV